MDRVLRSIGGFRLVDHTNAQRAHLGIIETKPGDVAEWRSTPNHLGRGIDARPEIRLCRVDNRPHDVPEALYELLRAFLADRVIWVGWPPFEADTDVWHVFTCCCGFVQDRFSFTLNTEDRRLADQQRQLFISPPHIP